MRFTDEHYSVFFDKISERDREVKQLMKTVEQISDEDLHGDIGILLMRIAKYAYEVGAGYDLRLMAAINEQVADNMVEDNLNAMKFYTEDPVKYGALLEYTRARWMRN